MDFSLYVAKKHFKFHEFTVSNQEVFKLNSQTFFKLIMELVFMAYLMLSGNSCLYKMQYLLGHDHLGRDLKGIALFLHPLRLIKYVQNNSVFSYNNHNYTNKLCIVAKLIIQ